MSVIICYNLLYEGSPINKLQNGIILLIFNFQNIKKSEIMILYTI